MKIGTLTVSIVTVLVATVAILLVISGQLLPLAIVAIGALTYAFIAQRHITSREKEIAEYRRLLATDAKCLFWEARVSCPPDWRSVQDTSDDYRGFEWELRPLDPQAAETIFGPGYDLGNFTRLWINAVLPEDMKECLRRFHHALLNGSTRLTQTYRLRDYTGQVRWYLESIRIRPDGDNHWTCTGVVIDITDRKDAEQAIVESENHLRQLMLRSKSLLFEGEVRVPDEFKEIPASPQLIWSFKPVDPDILQNLLPMNTPDDAPLSFTHFAHSRHPDDVDVVDRTFVEAVTNHSPGYSQEYRCRNRYGVYQWFAETVHITYLSDRHWKITGTVQDITDRKRAEESIRDVMRQADCIVFYGDVVLDPDPAATEKFHWNLSLADIDAAQRVVPLAVTPQKGYIHVWRESIAPDDIDRIRDDVQKAIAEKAHQFSLTYRVRDAHDKWHWISQDIRLEQIGATSYRVVAVCVDITAQKQIQEELERARIAAEEASNAKTTFLANMSHEIRTPMTAVIGYADLLIGNVSPAERESYARTIQRNCEHLMTVLDDILDLSRIESGKMTIQVNPCSPVEIAEEVTEMLRPRAKEKGLELAVEVKTNVPRQIHTDPVRLRQILVNLTGNAIKFTDQGGVLIRLDHLPDKYSEPMLIVEVVDTGIGISHDQIPLLFRPFHQGDVSASRKFGGTGLGLAISRRLAQLLGGDVTVTSTPGEGSTFTVRITGRPAEQATPHYATHSTTPVRLDGIRVLLAEDGADTRRLVGIHLRRLGCECVAVENGQEAIDKAIESENSETPFDVILMDMQMPVLDGYNACKVLREQGYTRGIIALTAHAMEGDRDRCIKAGCDDYVVKPINVAHLSRTISRHARHSRNISMREQDSRMTGSR